MFALLGVALTGGVEVWRLLDGAGSRSVATVANTLTVSVLLIAIWAVRARRFRAGTWIFEAGTTAVSGLAVAAPASSSRATP